MSTANGLTRVQAQALRRLIAAYVKASDAESWSGGGAPEDADSTRESMLSAGARLDTFITKLLIVGGQSA